MTASPFLRSFPAKDIDARHVSASWYGRASMINPCSSRVLDHLKLLVAVSLDFPIMHDNSRNNKDRYSVMIVVNYDVILVHTLMVILAISL